jgi:hypothetical protein
MERTQCTPLFDFGQPVQVTAMVGLRSTTVEPCTAPWDEVFGTVRTAATKDGAPSVIPATFRAESVLWTRSGRPRKDQAEACTAIIIDLDGFKCPSDFDPMEPVSAHPDYYTIESGDIEDALCRLGLAGTYWSTWSSRADAPRWRIAVPLSHPVVPKAQERVWRAVAQAIIDQLRDAVHPKVNADWAARGATQPAILPVRPAPGPQGEGRAASHRTSPWGMVVPSPVHVDGCAVVPEEVERAANSVHYGRRLAFVQAARTGRAATGDHPAPRPYTGVCDAPGAAETVSAWRADRTATLTLTAGLDALARVRRDGLGARPGGRGSVIAAACFHLFRCGEPVAGIRSWGDAALAATGGRTPAANLVRDLESQVRDFARREGATVAWAASARAALAEGAAHAPREHQVDAATRYCTILARAEHLRRVGGGQLAFDQIALVVGMPTAAVVAWRRRLQEVGMLDQWGESRSTHYRIREVA